MPTKIEWCDAVWNPAHGCKNGCLYCYARGIDRRFADVIAAPYADRLTPIGVKALADRLREFKPTWLQKNYDRKFPRKAFRIFVNSMSDICWWEEDWLEAVSNHIKADRDRYYIFLTKRPQVYQDNFGFFNHPNILRGMTLTGNNGTDFSYDRGTAPLAFVQFVSIEPLLVDGAAKVLHLFPNLKWIIVGAQTGNSKGKVYPKPQWIRDIVAYATEKNIPIFMKESIRTYCDGKNLRFVQEHCV